MQKVLFVGLLLLLLGCGAFLYFTADAGPHLAMPGSDDPAAAAGDAVPATATTEPHPAADATAEASGTGTAERAAAVLDEATQRPLPDNPKWIVVKVVEKATGSPLAGAVVHWFDETSWEYLMEKGGESEQYRELHWQGERFAELAGWRTRSDAQGLARVTSAEWTTVLAQHGTLHGKTILRGRTVEPIGGHVVELVPDLSLTVRVVDDRGTPTADVPITVSVLDKDGDQVASFGWSSIHRSRAPDGLATIQHLQSLRAEVQGNSGPGAAKLEWRVRLFLPGHLDPGVAFDVAAPPAEPIELRLPPCGSLRVRAEFAGKPVPGFRTAWLSQERGNEWRGFQSNRLATVDADGQARFSFVPLAQEYQVGSDAIGGLYRKTPGPQHPGQEVEVLLSPADDAMIVTGRLLLPDRTPAGDRRITVRATGPNLRAQPELRTDHEGRFVVSLGSPRKDNRLDQLWFELQKKGEVPLRAEAAGRTLRPGIEELGDLLLDGGALLVAGNLVAGGQPFTDPVSLRVEREEPGAAGRPARWRRVDGQLEYKDGSGGFTIRGTAQPGRHRLVVNSENLLPVVPIEFQVGATDVVVALDPGQGLAASLLLPEQAPTEAVTAVLVSAVPPTPAPENPRNNRLTQRPEGRRGNRHDLRWPSIPAGTYSLEIRLWTVDKPLVAIPDIVLPLPAAGDPRLVDIDLRTLLRVVAFTMREAGGDAVSDNEGVLFPTAQASANEWLAHGFWSASPRVLLPAGPYDLLVCLSGYRPQPVRGNSDQVEVRLDRWPTIVVHVPEIPKLPDRARVQVALQPTERSPLRYRTQWSSGDRAEYVAPPQRNVTVVAGKASVPIGEGLHTLRVSLSANRRSHTLEGHTPQQVLSTVGEVVVTVPKEQWEKAIATVSQPPK